MITLHTVTFALALALCAVGAIRTAPNVATIPQRYATSHQCTGAPSLTLHAEEWTRVEGLDNDQGGFGGSQSYWRLSIPMGAYSEERFTLITFGMGSGSWADAIASPRTLRENKRYEVCGTLNAGDADFQCTITAPHGVDSSNGCGVFIVSPLAPIYPTHVNGGVEASCTRM